MVSLLLIVKNKKFLFCKRRPDDEVYASYWGLPGGSVERGETAIEGMIREVKEEIGIDIEDYYLMNVYPNSKGEKNIHLFVHRNDEFDPSTIELNEEHTQYKFFTYYEIEESEEDFIPSTTNILLDYIKNT